MGQKYTFPQAKMLAELIAVLVNRALPETTSLDPRPEHRKSRVYLDTTRNARGQAVAGPYSARPHPGATASAPLKWSEVGRKLDPARFTVKTMPGRIEKVVDLWQAVLGAGIDLGACLKVLEKLCG
jgi:bifunctional non-homologous end joining protein LigD